MNGEEVNIEIIHENAKNDYLNKRLEILKRLKEKIKIKEKKLHVKLF
jgi:hypothetical protein